MHSIKILVFVLIAQLSFYGSTEAKEPLPELANVILDRQVFIKQLPKVALIAPLVSNQRERSKAGALSLIERELEKLGPTPDTKFQLLPSSARFPEVKSTVMPVYPIENRDSGKEGEATFLVFVGVKGQVIGLYCTSMTDKSFARNAAAALARWTFKPAEINDIKVPAVVMLPMVFTLNGGS